MPLQLRSHCRRSPLGAAAFLQLWRAGWHARCCGASGAVACPLLWRVWRCGMLGAVVHLRSDALGTAAHLAQRRT